MNGIACLNKVLIFLNFIVYVLLRGYNLYMLEVKPKKERDPDLEVEEDISIFENMEKNWKNIVEENINKKGGSCIWVGVIYEIEGVFDKEIFFGGGSAS